MICQALYANPRSGWSWRNPTKAGGGNERECVCEYRELQKGWGCPGEPSILEGVTFLEQLLRFLPVFLRFSLL